MKPLSFALFTISIFVSVFVSITVVAAIPTTTSVDVVPSHSSMAIDDERLLNALVQRGVICPNLSAEEQAIALTIYLQRKQTAQEKEKTQQGKTSKNQNEHQVHDVNANKQSLCISPETKP